MQVAFVKTKDAQPVGEYKPTAIDDLKSTVDFRVVGVGSKNSIAWKDGRMESVTDRQLEKLQKSHSWTTDF